MHILGYLHIILIGTGLPSMRTNLDELELVDYLLSLHVARLEPETDQNRTTESYATHDIVV